jgi:hypothetical protein
MDLAGLSGKKRVDNHITRMRLLSHMIVMITGLIGDIFGDISDQAPTP